MSDAYWRYTDSQQQPPSSVPPVVGKRPRVDYDTTGLHELPNYYPRQDDRPVLQGIKSVDSINESYERYLRTSQISSYGGQSARPVGGGVPGHLMNDPPILGIGGVVSGANVNDRSTSFGGGRPNIPLPPDASNTLFVEGLPSSCTRREVAHIFRPFVGYKEVRLVNKESRSAGRDPVVLGFVDFVSPAHAATAMDALQEVAIGEFVPSIYIFILACLEGKVVYLSSFCVIRDVLLLVSNVFTQTWPHAEYGNKGATA
ncbi:RNA-binding protein 2-like isoform X1 [Cucumis melo var. makuwa]|uniref:RNA-binding protein 2-like isoform X1 n=1 Tax=Cucumis melo var. makuwa TaxID=1194695 RepID=A0A5A7U8N8_CUCMM|nr:RNA-binding protein 2-like isoform X1 [Cucumis melo var. makuwa]